MLPRRTAPAWLVLLFLLLISPVPALAGESCEDWLGRIESVQGTLLAQKAGQDKWIEVFFGDTFCPEDKLQTTSNSRAAIFLRTGGVLRLDENTAIRLEKAETGNRSIIDFLSGIALFFSRNPFSLKVNTPFVNANVEGTEFLVKLEKDGASLTVFEGRLSAESASGSTSVESGHTASFFPGRLPEIRSMVRPENAVAWAIYYPPVPEIASEVVISSRGTEWERAVAASVESYNRGDLAGAFSAIGGFSAVRDPSFLNYRALLLLAAGRVDQASIPLDEVLAISPHDTHALALRSVIAVAQNNKDRALELARRSVEAGPSSSAAFIALSYAQQARFDIKGALASTEKAVGIDPHDAYAWARLSELRLSSGYLHKALDAAQQAVIQNPAIARTQTVLGFAHLMQISLDEAMQDFNKAIRLDQADPLPRLGLGLAMIRGGDLAGGRWQIEIAAILDPWNSIIRSYLGKAYFDEKRDRQASVQFQMAKELDPLDPTPWFYSAIQKETQNRPVEALDELNKSIQLNDNRAVYRSRLMLDQDLAARSAGLARIFRDLGFDRRALVEGWNSLNTDPTNYSAHRFLADAYATMPRHDIARVSELLQSQLLQPLNLNPIQPQMGEKSLFLPISSGPVNPSFSEYNALFTRDKASLLLSGVAGEHGTLADEAIVSGIYGRYSASIGQYHYETDGTWPNGNFRRNLYNIFFQTMVTPDFSFLLEYRNNDTTNGDLTRLFSPIDLLTRQEMRNSESVRFGVRASLGPSSELIAHYGHTDFDDNINFTVFDVADLLSYAADKFEAQYLYRSERFNLVAGGGTTWIRSKENMTYSGFPAGTTNNTIASHIGYAYSYIKWPENFTWTVGASGSLATGIVQGDESYQQVNPKVGITWNPFPGTTLRAAAFRTLIGSGVSPGVFSGETIEPTQIAGFNQYFDDPDGTRAWHYGVGIDQKFNSSLLGGLEYSLREKVWWGIDANSHIFDFDIHERSGRAYLYWTPHKWLAIGPEYQYEHYSFTLDQTYYGISELTSHKAILGASFFHPSGFFTQLKPTWVWQNGKFLKDLYSSSSIYDDIDSSFFVLDALIGYRLPRRLGFISVEARNLFDRSFRFHEIDPFTPTFYPQRWIMGKVTIFF